MLADLLTTLERLIGLGFSPFMALIVGFVIVLAGVIGTGFLFFWRQLGKERDRQDKIRAQVDEERAAWRKDVEERLETSEGKHHECEQDRTSMRTEIETVKGELDRMRRCPRRDCPMRLPG